MFQFTRFFNPNPQSPADGNAQPYHHGQIKAVRLLGLASGLLAFSTFLTQAAYSATFVNTQLLLSVDVSGSINSNEFDLQRDGYANAFRNTELIQSIEGNPSGIAVALSYWADRAMTAIDWFHITNEASALAFADAIEAADRPSSFGSSGIGSATNIAGAMDYASTLFASDGFTSDRRILDISGDGPQNTSSLDVLAASRQALLDQNIVINGLPILVSPFSTLDTYYADNVIGGSGSFIEVAADFDSFETAALNKIGREVKPPTSPNPTDIPEPTTTVALMLFGMISLRSVLKQAQSAA